jgi:hypothetical protein
MSAWLASGPAMVAATSPLILVSEKLMRRTHRQTHMDVRTLLRMKKSTRIPSSYHRLAISPFPDRADQSPPQELHCPAPVFSLALQWFPVSSDLGGELLLLFPNNGYSGR